MQFLNDSSFLNLSILDKLNSQLKQIQILKHWILLKKKYPREIYPDFTTEEKKTEEILYKVNPAVIDAVRTVPLVDTNIISNNRNINQELNRTKGNFQNRFTQVYNKEELQCAFPNLKIDSEGNVITKKTIMDIKKISGKDPDHKKAVLVHKNQVK